MDAETARWAWGIAIAAIFALIGIIYWLLRAEDKRLSKNIHALRNDVQSLAIKLATLMGRNRER